MVLTSYALCKVSGARAKEAHSPYEVENDLLAEKDGGIPDLDSTPLG